MAYKKAGYRPNEKSREILARAWKHLESVPYRVTARWLFYRLLQDGIYSKKSDYGRFLELTSRARHNDYEGWRPDTLEDDTRRRIVRGEGDESAEAWIDGLKEAGVVRCELDKWQDQRYYVQIWFEANAMVSQFKYHTEHITLCPFGGMPSIPYKYKLAKSLERSAGRPVKVLYFGDYDPAGVTIEGTSTKDIRGWCGVDFEVIRVGLNAGDAERHGIPENPDHPGAYQWEALDAESAGKMIEGAVQRHVDLAAMRRVALRERDVEHQFRQYISGWEYTTSD